MQKASEIKRRIPKLIILRTEQTNLQAVIKESKHALNSRLSARLGDILLLSEKGSCQVTRGMKFMKQIEDSCGETKRIWQRSWKYLIEADKCEALSHPFKPQEERITDPLLKNYLQGGPFFYVLEEDAVEFYKRGLLQPLLLD